MRRTIIALLTAALVVSTTLLSSVPASAEAPLTPEVSVPLPSMYGEATLLVATGATLVRQVYVTSHSTEKEYSLDNGTSWAPVPDAVAAADQLLGYKGSVIGLQSTTLLDGEDGCDVKRLDGFVVWNPTSGSIRNVAVTPEQSAAESECLGMGDTAANLVEVNDGVLDISGSTAVDRAITWGPKTPTGAHAQKVSADGTAVAAQVGVWDTATNQERTYLAIGSTDGKAAPAAREIPGMSGVVVSGQRVHYLVSTKRKLAVCRALLSAPARPTCITLRSGDSRGFDAYLEVSQGLELVSHHLHDTDWTWMVRGSTVRKLRSTATVAEVQGTSFRDPQRPLVSGIHSTYGGVYGRVSSSLGVDWSIRSRKVPTRVQSLALTPNRVTTFDTRPYFRDGGPLRLSYRTLTSDVVGPEVRLSGAGTTDKLFASAARTATDCCTSVKAHFYDQAKLVLSRRLTFNVQALSGPYVAGDDRVWRVDGKTYPTGDYNYPAIFGSLAATLDTTADVVTIRDLARPGTTPITVSLPAGHEYFGGDLRLWGDWISIPWGDVNDVDAAQGGLVVNYRTQQAFTTDGGRVTELGDGFALLYQYGAALGNGEGQERTVRVWNFLTDQTMQVPVRWDHEVAIDGISQVAWVSDTAIEIAKVAGAGQNAPRLLGVVAASTFLAGRSWKPQIDASKPLSAGVLEIRNSGGQLVRTVGTRPTASGSFRSLSWNGLNEAGRKVPAGTYSWVLTAEAADGTGMLKDVTGQGAASGTVRVTR